MQDEVSMPRTWQAWTWTGQPDPLALALQTVPAATPGSGQVLVRNAVIGLNPVDWKVLGGDLVDWQPGKVPGVDGAGEVVAVGSDIPNDWLGKRVAYHTSLASPGSFAEYTAVDARALLTIPSAVDFDTAASVPCPALTAWLALDKLPPRRHARVLVSGAGGAVGLYSVQLAAMQGFEVSVMCHPRHGDRLRALGASECFEGPLDSNSEWPRTQANRFFAIVDAVDAAHAARLSPALSANGHLVCIQGRVEGWPSPPFGRTMSLHEVALGAMHQHGSNSDWARLVDAGNRILQLIADGRMKSEPLLTGRFDALPERLDALRHRSVSGKSIVAVSSFHRAVSL
ncbi:zinc-binding dehydrogenase [Trinickia caryophylli]|uniref:NADPH:quinone reductase n=1 Tax=Trinickia caryophylli TaxID=28094 RepID=A0A1X7H819_TRICW|nr:zinc-binding dehydrogenase [Trinickia caryophylli]PMS09496.1 alcohol dehydrogenase [Trinickia caryophylli]TRX14114.1 alcohol dehydrogenase [Trinickia caryophylli]WQE13932.1 zinc-binding dehydrogenase [Trinickia caryophylli]SMF81150.1 NADPH:quinone reductase [Trinickia caryophylli]GLU35723.1 alcohol dehydrogenase [Trinickia caryophylli]